MPNINEYLNQLNVNLQNAFVNQELAANYQQEVQLAMEKVQKTPWIRPTRSVSQLSDEYQALEAQLKGLTKSIHQEQGEMENALEQLSRITEAVRDTGSLIRQHLATLQQVATRLENLRQTGLQRDLPGYSPALPEVPKPLEQAPQIAEVGGAVFGLAPLPEGQV